MSGKISQDKAAPVDLHFEAARWYLRHRHNVVINAKLPPALDTRILYTAGMLAVAGADGLAEEELDWIQGLMATVGAPRELFDRIPEMLTWSLDDVLERFNKNLPGGRAEHLLYNCVEALGADGVVGGEELGALKRVAATLGVAPGRVDSLHAMFLEEQQWRKEHLELIWQGGERASPLSAMSAADASDLRYKVTKFFCTNRLGCDIGRAPAPSAEARETYAAALLVCAGADGLDPAERDWIRGFFACLGAPQDLFDKFDDLGGRTVEDVCAKFSDLAELATSRRSFLYDCIGACGADGDLDEKEIAAIKRFAVALAVTDADECVDKLCADYRAEMQVKKKYLKLMNLPPMKVCA